MSDTESPPTVGTVWWWERGKPHAEELVTVVKTEWNGEEWWVESVSSAGISALNDLDRWNEATTPISAAPPSLRAAIEAKRQEYTPWVDGHRVMVHKVLEDLDGQRKVRVVVHLVDLGAVER